MLTTPPRRHGEQEFHPDADAGDEHWWRLLLDLDRVSDIHVRTPTPVSGGEAASASTGGQASDDAQAGYGLDPIDETRRSTCMLNQKAINDVCPNLAGSHIDKLFNHVLAPDCRTR